MDIKMASLKWIWTQKCPLLDWDFQLELFITGDITTKKPSFFKCKRATSSCATCTIISIISTDVSRNEQGGFGLSEWWTHLWGTNWLYRGPDFNTRIITVCSSSEKVPRLQRLLFLLINLSFAEKSQRNPPLLPDPPGKGAGQWAELWADAGGDEAARARPAVASEMRGHELQREQCQPEAAAAAAAEGEGQRASARAAASRSAEPSQRTAARLRC